MATTTEANAVLGPFEGRIVLHGVDWGDYDKMLEIVGERHIHVTYDEGTMEVSMPSERHERAAQLFGLFVPRLAEELEVRLRATGHDDVEKAGRRQGFGGGSVLLHPE